MWPCGSCRHYPAPSWVRLWQWPFSLFDHRSVKITESVLLYGNTAARPLSLSLPPIPQAIIQAFYQNFCGLLTGRDGIHSSSLGFVVYEKKNTGENCNSVFQASLLCLAVLLGRASTCKISKGVKNPFLFQHWQKLPAGAGHTSKALRFASQWCKGKVNWITRLKNKHNRQCWSSTTGSQWTLCSIRDPQQNFLCVIQTLTPFFHIWRPWADPKTNPW